MAATSFRLASTVLLGLLASACGPGPSTGGGGSTTGMDESGTRGEAGTTGDPGSSSGGLPEPDVPEDPPLIEPDCDVEEAFPRGTCDAGLCWVAPYPTGDHLLAAYQVGDDIFLGGAHGIRHRRNGVWSRTLTDRRILKLAGRGPDEVYAMADALLLWDGNTWEPEELGVEIEFLTDVAVSPEGDVYLAAHVVEEPFRVVLVRSDEGWMPLDGWQDGIPCVPQVRCGIDGVIPLAPDDVWLVRNSIFATPVVFPMELAHFDGSEWTWRTLEGFAGSVKDVQILAPDDVWMATGGLLHYDGNTWTGVSTDEHDANAVFARGPDDIWIGGDTLVHWDGEAWSPKPKPEQSRLGANDFGGAPDPEAPLWLASIVGAYEHADGAWDPTFHYLSHVDGCGNGAPWFIDALASDHPLARPGSDTWDFGVQPDKQPYDIAVLGAEDVWISAIDGTLQHFDGASWSEVSLPGRAGRLSALPGGRVLAVTEPGAESSTLNVGDRGGFEVLAGVPGSVWHTAPVAADDVWLITAQPSSAPSWGYELVHVTDAGVETHAIPALDYPAEYVDLLVREDGLPWAVAEDRVLAFDGTAWSEVCQGRGLGRAAVHDDAVWVTSLGGMLRLGDGSPQVSLLPDFLEGAAQPGTFGHSLYGTPWINDAGVLWLVLHGGGVLAGNLDELPLEPLDCD